MEPKSPKGEAMTIPSELNGPMPRKVRSSPTGVSSAIIALVVVVIALSGTIWLSMIGVHKLEDQSALRRDGIRATSQVTGFSYTGKHGTILVVHYSFTANQVPLSGKASVPSKLEQDIRASRTLTVRYLPVDPTINHPEAWEESAVNAVVPLLAPLFPVVIGIIMLVNNQRERRLLAEGLPAIATITAAYYNPKRGNSAQYEFRTREGEIAIGSSLFENPQPVGSSLCVLYLPQNSKRNIPYPLMNYSISE